MLPFSQTLLLWRRYRGLTQVALAQRARISRPNLSAIEVGKREVSLTTLRALAAALDVRPGMLVDGVAPGVPPEGPKPLSRERLERIASAVASGGSLSCLDDRAIAASLERVVGHRTRAWRGRAGAPRRLATRASRLAWLWLEAVYSPQVARSLVQRVTDRLASR